MEDTEYETVVASESEEPNGKCLYTFTKLLHHCTAKVEDKIYTLIHIKIYFGVINWWHSINHKCKIEFFYVKVKRTKWIQVMNMQTRYSLMLL